MKFIKFNYTDAKGNKTQRQLMVTQEPSNKVSGIDVSEIDAEQQAMLAEAYNTAYDRFISEVELLKAEFDVKHNFRQFFPEKMEILETDRI